MLLFFPLIVQGSSEEVLEKYCVYVQQYMNTFIILLADSGLQHEHKVLNELVCVQQWGERGGKKRLLGEGGGGGEKIYLVIGGGEKIFLGLEV